MAISASLFEAKSMVEKGVVNVDRVIAEITHLLSLKRRIRVIYVQVVDDETMEAVKTIQPGRSRVCVAAWIDGIRLIDNCLL